MLCSVSERISAISYSRTLQRDAEMVDGVGSATLRFVKQLLNVIQLCIRIKYDGTCKYIHWNIGTKFRVHTQTLPLYCTDCEWDRVIVTVGC